MQWDPIIPNCVYRLSVVVPFCINYVVLYMLFSIAFVGSLPYPLILNYGEFYGIL